MYVRGYLLSVEQYCHVNGNPLSSFVARRGINA